MIRPYDDLTRALDVLYVCALMVEHGIWTTDNLNTPMDYDFYYETVQEALYNCCDHVFGDYNENSDVEHTYFSAPCMMEYYRLCREYSKRRGIKLKENPYMLRAKGYVDNQLNGSYSCWHILHTKVNHDCASGIHFMQDCYFDQHTALLERMLGIMQFYRDGAEEIKAELAKPTALAIIYPQPVRKAAA